MLAMPAVRAAVSPAPGLPAEVRGSQGPELAVLPDVEPGEARGLDARLCTGRLAGVSSPPVRLPLQRAAART